MRKIVPLFLAVLLLFTACGTAVNTSPQPKDSTTSSIALSSILLEHLPDATPVENLSLFDGFVNARIHSKIDQFIDYVKSQTAFIGTLVDYAPVTVENNNKLTLVTLLEIRVDDPLCHSEKNTTLRAITVCSYQEDETGYSLTPGQIGNHGLDTIMNPYGFFVLESTENRSIHLNGEELCLSDLAEYTLQIRCDYDGEYIRYPNLISHLSPQALKQQ